MGDPRFLDRLHSLDKNNIDDKQLLKLKDYVNNKDFLPDAVIKVSKVNN